MQPGAAPAPPTLARISVKPEPASQQQHHGASAGQALTNPAAGNLAAAHKAKREAAAARQALVDLSPGLADPNTDDVDDSVEVDVVGDGPDDTSAVKATGAGASGSGGPAAPGAHAACLRSALLLPYPALVTPYLPRRGPGAAAALALMRKRKRPRRPSNPTTPLARSVSRQTSLGTSAGSTTSAYISSSGGGGGGGGGARGGSSGGAVASSNSNRGTTGTPSGPTPRAGASPGTVTSTATAGSRIVMSKGGPGAGTSSANGGRSTSGSGVVPTARSSEHVAQGGGAAAAGAGASGSGRLGGEAATSGAGHSGDSGGSAAGANGGAEAEAGGAGGGVNGEPDPNARPRKKRQPSGPRGRFSAEAVAVLRAEFDRNAYPEPETVNRLAAQVGDTTKRVKRWFQTRRANERQAAGRRRGLTPQAVSMLREAFARDPNPDAAAAEQLAAAVGVPGRGQSVLEWFALQRHTSQRRPRGSKRATPAAAAAAATTAPGATQLHTAPPALTPVAPS